MAMTITASIMSTTTTTTTTSTNTDIAIAVELQRARALGPFVEASDFLLDIHSMLEPSPPVMICGPLEKGIRFAFDVGVPRNIVSDTGHSNGTRMRDYGGFGDPANPKNALLVECGQHSERNSERGVRQA